MMSNNETNNFTHDEFYEGVLTLYILKVLPAQNRLVVLDRGALFLLYLIKSDKASYCENRNERYVNANGFLLML